MSNAHLTCSVCRSNAEWSAFNSGPVNIPAATLYPPLRFDRWTGFSKQREVPPQVWLRDKAASCCDCVKGDESASVREREKAKGRMKSCLSMCTKELSWFVPGTFALQRWMNNCKLSRQLWYCPHTSHLHPCTALEVVVTLAIKQCLTRFHSVFHLDAQLLLKVQKVLLLMAYFTWP